MYDVDRYVAVDDHGTAALFQALIERPVWWVVVASSMSGIYGPRQMGTEDQGWVAHFLIRALEGRRITVYGDGGQIRDVLDVGDAVAAYQAVLARIAQVKGRADNLGSGPANAVSLRQVLAAIEALVGHPLDVGFEEWRAGDQRDYVSDTRRIAADLGLAAPLPWRQGLARLAEWLAGSRGLRLTPREVPARNTHERRFGSGDKPAATAWSEPRHAPAA